MSSVPEPPGPDTLREVVRIDDGQIRSHLDQVVRESVEQTLNALLDAEADALCNARKYERSPDRLDTRGRRRWPLTPVGKRNADALRPFRVGRSIKDAHDALAQGRRMLVHPE
jgi:hypothetical protein